MHNTITIKETIFIDKPPEVVWDFTQDYNQRPAWDHTILATTVIQVIPYRIVNVRAKWNVHMTFHYKLDDRPNKTTLAMNVKSSVIERGGGSWTYVISGKGTLWTRIDTLVLKDHFWNILLKPMMAYQLKLSTRRSLKRAKKMIESIRESFSV